MKLKKYIEFLNESISIHKGNFTVTSNMVSNGMLIKEIIPREVTGDFWCSDNILSSLEGSPETVCGSFSCSNNKLISLEGSPESVGGGFNCSFNQLTSLKGCPESINSDFNCFNNNITSLKGGPKTVGKNFYYSFNQLSSLEYGPSGFSGLMIGDKDLEIEKEFIESGEYKENYWKDLLKYMTSKHIDLEEIKTWPKGFITDNMIQSVKGLNKFGL